MKFDKLMQYQKCDAQAIKLERKLSDSEHKKSLLSNACCC